MLGPRALAPRGEIV